MDCVSTGGWRYSRRGLLSSPLFPAGARSSSESEAPVPFLLPSAASMNVGESPTRSAVRSSCSCRAVRGWRSLAQPYLPVCCSEEAFPSRWPGNHACPKRPSKTAGTPPRTMVCASLVVCSVCEEDSPLVWDCLRLDVCRESKKVRRAANSLARILTRGLRLPGRTGRCERKFGKV